MGRGKQVVALMLAYAALVLSGQADIIFAKPESDVSKSTGWYGNVLPKYGEHQGFVETEVKVDKGLKDLDITVNGGVISAKKKPKVEGGAFTLIEGTVESDDGWTFKNSKHSELIFNMSGGTLSATRDVKFEGGGVSLSGGKLVAGHNMKFKKTDLMMTGGTLEVAHDLEFDDGAYHIENGLLLVDHKLKIKDGAQLTLSGSTTLILSGDGKTFDFGKAKKGKDRPVLNFEDWSGTVEVHDVDELMDAIDKDLIYIDGELALKEQFRFQEAGERISFSIVPEPGVVTLVCFAGGVFIFLKRRFGG